MFLDVALYSPLAYNIPPLPSINDLGILHSQESNPQTPNSQARSRISGKVEDIAFFTKEGKYQWLRNAFDQEIRAFTIIH